MPNRLLSLSHARTHARTLSEAHDDSHRILRAPSLALSRARVLASLSLACPRSVPSQVWVVCYTYILHVAHVHLYVMFYVCVCV